MAMMALHGHWFGLVHGFNVRDRGEHSTDRLREPLEDRGATVEEFDRAHEGLLGATLGADSASLALAKGVRAARQGRLPQDIVLVGHSHGCHIIRRMFELVPGSEGNCRRVVLINPALRVDATFPPCVKVLCMYSPHDYTVASSRLLRWLPWRWLWPHPWGEAGRKGLEAGAVNANLEEVCRWVPIRHSDVFKDRALTERAVDRMDRWLAGQRAAANARTQAG